MTPAWAQIGQLAAWWAQLQALENPIRREMHLFTLLSGLRRTDVVSASWANIVIDASTP